MIEPKLVHANIWPREPHRYTVEKYEPGALISCLSSILVSLSHYATKEEILNLMDNYFNDHEKMLHQQLFDCFLDHQLIVQEKDSISFSVHLNQPNKNGVFTPFTKCYSSTCQIDGLLCYSALCPNNKKRIKSLECLNNFEYNDDTEDQQLDSLIEISKTFTRPEMKRQAAISELLSTEYNYYQDLTILDQIYAIPLLESEQVIDDLSRRQRFYHTVFGNYREITQLHKTFYNKTTMHWQQSKTPVHSGVFYGQIGKYILEHVNKLVEPYLTYTAHHAKSVHCLTLEQCHNTKLTEFLKIQDKRQCTRRLGIYHYLTSPTLWIGKLKLLVEAILKNTPASNEIDRLALISSVTMLHKTLLQMNQLPITTTKELRQVELLTCMYVYDSNAKTQFKLLDIPDNSRLVEEDTVKLIRTNHHSIQSTVSHIFLFSHALVVAHQRIRNERTEYVVLAGFPIPIEMLFIDLLSLTIPSSSSSSFMGRLSSAKSPSASSSATISNSYQQRQLISSIRNLNTDHCVATLDASKKEEINTPERSTTSSMIKQIKTKILKLTTIKHQPSLSAPVSPISSEFPSLSRPTRRGSEPVLLKNSKQQKSFEDKTLKLGHKAQPEFLFQLLFDSRIKREGWKTILADKVHYHAQKKKIVEMQELLDQSIIELSSSTTSSSSAVSASFSLVDKELDITCACSFNYSNKNYLALATKDGLFIGPDTECNTFIPMPSIRQISMMEEINGLVILIGNRLVQYTINELLLMNTTENSFQQQGTLVSPHACCFTIGKIKNQAIIFYITLEQTLILNTPKRMEYKLSTKDPISIQWLDPIIMVKSLTSSGNECIDVTDERNNSFKISTGPIIGCAPLDRHHGILSNSYCGWFYSNNQPDKKEQIIQYESHVNHIAICYPYLFCFSTFVIEVRSLKTTNLLQVIQGYHIRYLTHNASHLYFTMSTKLFKIQI